MISIDDFNPLNGLIAEMILKYELQKETIFFIDLREYEAKEQIKTLSDKGFIIGSHTVSHAFLNEVSLERAEWELSESKKQLEAITGQIIDWISYPRGRFNEEIINLAKKYYKYGRTTRLFDEDNMRLGGCHLSYPRKEYEMEDPFDYAKKSHLNHYWAHTSELLRFNKLKKFEDFLVWYKEKYGKN